MRRELLYLQDILEAADAISRFLAGVEAGAFLSDELRQSAVLQKLAVIGEAAARIPDNFRERYPAVPWRDIVAFRNIGVHAYFAVDWQIVWTTAKEDVPALRQQVAAILASETGPAN